MYFPDAENAATSTGSYAYVMNGGHVGAYEYLLKLQPFGVKGRFWHTCVRAVE